MLIRVLVAIWLLALMVPTQLNGVVTSGILGEIQEQKDPGLLVLAAASLSDVLPRIGEEWERLGGRPLAFSFDATSRLAVQAARGGLGDIFFSADAAWIQWLEGEVG